MSYYKIKLVEIAMALELEEKILVKQAQQGSNKAFEVIIDTYKELVFRTSMGFLHNEEDANDLTQEVFVQLYRSISDFRGDSKLSTWLYRIAVNKSLNMVRSRKSRSWLQSLENFFGGEKTELQVETPNYRTDSGLENQDRVNAIQQALEGLAEKQRIAFVLSKYEDLSYAEIATVMDTSISSVESLLHRAKSNLKKKLIHIYREL